MSSSQIQKTESGFKMTGLLNFENVPLLYKQGIRLLKGATEVRIDLSEIAYADSSAIALLLNWIRTAKKDKKSVLFYNLPIQLREMATVCEVMPFLAPYVISENTELTTE